MVFLRLTGEQHDILKLEKNPPAAHAMDHILCIISEIGLGRDDFYTQRLPCLQIGILFRQHRHAKGTAKGVDLNCK